jgi:hypothetical protein
MKFKEQKELVRDLRDLADFYERPESIVLPKPHINPHETIYEGKWGDDPDTGEYGFIHDHDAAKARLKRYIRAIGSCEKDWGSDSLRVVKKVGNIKLTYQIDRKVICEKKVVGKKKVPMRAYVEIPGKFDEIEEVEWVCEDVALLS